MMEAASTFASEIADVEAKKRLAELWEATGRLLDGATIPGILAHGLGPLAANHVRRLGGAVPRPLLLEERAASLSMLTGIPLVERVRASCDGPLVLLKGPEVARLYPGSARRFSDLDLLSPNPDAVHSVLMASGFVEVEYPDWDVTPEHHHLQPLQWPTIWLKVEVHKHPSWPERAPRQPPLDEILDARIPSVLGIDGVFAPAPTHHALILAAHAWVHEPLQSLRDLIDIATVAATVDERELARTADAWGIGRVWQSTYSAIEAIFYGGAQTTPLRTWARHLSAVRERTILESHLQRAAHPFWELPLHQASLQLGRALRGSLTPLPGETWGKKLRRTRRAVLKPGAFVTRHEPRLGGKTESRRTPDG